VLPCATAHAGGDNTESAKSVETAAAQKAEAALDEVRRIIREEEPRKPSTRLSTIGDTLPSVCAHRKIEPRKLTQLLSGDLDWIVMKALEKDRTRRYETANGFARDIQRYLADEVVEARSPSAGYRLRKAIRRNKVALTAGVLVGFALLGGTVVSMWQATLARDARQLAEVRLEAEEAAHEDAEEARKAESHQRQQAEANLRKAQEAVEKYYTTVSESKLLNVPGMLPLRKELLRSALEYYQGFKLALTDHPAALADLAVAELRVVQIMYWNGDQGDRWLPHLQTGIEILEQLVREGRDTPDVQRRVAGFLQSNPEPQYWEGGRNIDRRRTHDILLRAVKLWEKFAHDNPEVSGFQSDLASLNVFIAIDRAKVNQTNEAVVHAERARALWEELVHKHPEQPRYRLELARLYDEMAMLSSADTAKRLADKARELFEQLAAEFPGVPLYRTLLGSCYMKAGEAAESPDAAEQAYARAVDQFEKVAAEFPTVVSCQQDLAVACLKLADAMTISGNNAEAIKRYRQSITLFDALIAESPNFARVSTHLATSLYKLSRLLKTTGQDHEADETYQKARTTLPQDANSLNNFVWRVAAKPIEQEMDAAWAVEVAQKAVELAPTAGSYWNTLGVARYRAGDWKSAIAALEKSMDLRNGGDSSDWFFLAMVHWQRGEKTLARTWYETAWLWAAVHQPQSVDLARFRTEAATLMGLRDAETPVKVEDSELVEALDAAVRQIRWDRELASLSRAIEQHPGSPNAWSARANWLLNHGRFAEAEIDYSRLLELHVEDHWPWYLRGCLLAYLGREDQYRNHCPAMLAKFGDSKDFDVLERTSKSALLLPLGGGADIEPLTFRVDRAVKIAPESTWSMLLAGLTDFRAGRYPQAIGWLDKCIAAPADGYPARVIAANAYAAIARHQLGRVEVARAGLERATRQANNELPPLGSGDLNRGGAENWLIAQIALREAEATILGRSLPAPPQTTGPSVPARPPRPTAPTPFSDQMAKVPGMIQAEQFDKGGEGIAYHDTTHQNFGVGDRYRMESVDIDECSDAGKGFNIGGIVAGEWLAYSVDVREAATYDLDLRLCSPSGGRLHVKFGDHNATVPVEIPETGWGNWATITVKDVPLDAGSQLMRVVFDAGGSNGYVCNFNWIEVRRSTAAVPSFNTTNEIQPKNASSVKPD
jgi:tetratricopeptide (TPR) repeat protein